MHSAPIYIRMYIHTLHQDDTRVGIRGAVHTGPNDELEREMESAFPQQLQHVNELGVRMLYSDSVHIAQLHRRALLLDREFKAKVWRRMHTGYVYIYCPYIRTSLERNPAPSTLIKPYSLNQVIEALTFQQPPNGVEKHLDSCIQEQGGRKRAVEEEEEEEDMRSTERIHVAQKEKEHVCISMSPAAVAHLAARSSLKQDSCGHLNTNSQGHTEARVAAPLPVEFGR
jgi:hypothetical protein